MTLGITAVPRRVLGLGGVACLVLLGSAAGLFGTSAGAAAATSWGVPAVLGAGRLVPHPGSASILAGLSCPSPGNCWAVGGYASGSGAVLNQALHWNGARWSRVSVPSPGGTALHDVSELVGVSCASPGSCWAVGIYQNGSGAAELNQALHWNGARWSRVSVPSPGGTGSHRVSLLLGVRCISSANCWAVGGYIKPVNADLVNEALHWNGRTWSLVATPNPGSNGLPTLNALDGVACTTSANCWAVGLHVNGNGALVNQALHWNGRTWSRVPTPDPGGTGAGAISTLNDVACTTSANCWAVGLYVTGSGASLNQALHWNGTRWSRVPTPEPNGASNTLNGVTCASPANCWAVGSYGDIHSGTRVQVNQALHWNGLKWSLVATPDPAGTASGDASELVSVRCIRPASCWAVGDSRRKGGPDLSQALHWNATRWSTG
jgi:hypothetical protein